MWVSSTSHLFVHAICSIVRYRTSRYSRRKRFEKHESADRGRSVSRVVWKVANLIVKTTKITVRPEKRVELIQTMGRLLGPIKNVKGCRNIRFYLDAADENSSLLLSEWETESDLNRYLRSNDFAILRGAIRVLSVTSTDSKALVTSESNRDLITSNAPSEGLVR